MIPSYKISIITVVFNAAKTLEETIKSVIQQSYNNWEFIIVDGGSTDGTIDLLERYESAKVLWKSEPDKGIYDAMNKGIERASGEWIYFLGGDDVFIDSNVLEKIFSDKSYEVDYLYGNVFDKRSMKNYDGEFDRKKLLKRNICHQAIFFKKDLFNKIGNFETRYRLFGDWEFNLRCFSDENVKREYIDIVIANYSAGGASAENNDVLFFREVLFPRRIQNIKKEGLNKLKNIRVYDEWWRLLRSLRLKKNEKISDFVDEVSLPEILYRMSCFQKKFPYKILKVGIFSKAMMFVSYSQNLVTNKIP